MISERGAPKRILGAGLCGTRAYEGLWPIRYAVGRPARLRGAMAGK